MYTVFDVETTGLDVKTEKILEISCIKLDVNLRQVSEYTALIWRDVKIKKEITELSGITQDEMISKGRNFDDVKREVLAFMGDDILVAHNAGFDLSIWHHDAGVKVNQFYDTLTMGRIFCRWLTKFKLDTMCAEWGIELDRHHRSLYDTKATAELFKILFKMAKARNYDCLNLLSHREGQEIPTYEFMFRNLFYPINLPSVFCDFSKA